LTQAGLALVLTTVLTAVVHTLIPDHWLPFVLVARAEGWNLRRTVTMTASSALLHVTVSIALAMAVVLAGRSAEMAVTGLGDRLSALSGWMLVLFGLVYMGWFLMRGGHAHTFGIHPHHDAHDEAPPHASASRLKALSGHALAFVVGFNPCILVIPCVYGAAQLSPLVLVAVSAAFAASTILSMVIVTLLGLHGTSRLTSPFLTRYGEAFSGALIALTGTAVLLAGP
jgi:ABC-type nickel/cobalt efflux system permease component RcnA